MRTDLAYSFLHSQQGNGAMSREGTTWVATGLLGLCLALAPLAATAEEAPAQPPQDSPGELAREGLESVMRALRLLVESIPQSELPEVPENGAIHIRRKDGDEPPAGPPGAHERAAYAPRIARGGGGGADER